MKDFFRFVGFVILALIIAAPFFLNFDGVTEIRQRKAQKVSLKNRVKMSIPAYDANLSRKFLPVGAKVERLLLDSVQNRNI